jgi:hypothetical protein
VVGQTRVTRQTRVTTIARALEAGFAERDSDAEAAPIDRAKVDEMHLLDDWLRRNDTRLAVIALDPLEPGAAAESVLAAVRAQAARSQPAGRARAS